MLTLLIVIAILIAITWSGIYRPFRPPTRWGREPDAAEKDKQRDGGELSLYQRIRLQALANPAAPLNYEEFPPILSSDGAVFFPGARDIFTQMDTDGWTLVLKVIRDTDSGLISNWKSLEREISVLEPAAYFENVLQRLTGEDLTVPVRELFGQLALKSSNYAAVKWGITIAGTGANLPEMQVLLPLARHSELTFYICSALYRNARESFMPLIEELITMTEGWGLYQAIAHTAQISDLKKDWTLQRNCVVHGMLRGDGARNYIAEIILKELDPVALLDHATDDPELASAMMELLESLVWTPEPPGRLADLEGAERLITRYVEWLESRPPGIETVRGLRSLAIALGMESLAWESREILLQRVHDILLVHLDPNIVADAIRADHMREIALQLVVELGLTDLAPVVMEDFRKRPSALNIDVLGHIGEGEHLQLLFESLPDNHDMQSRSSVARDAAITGELHNSSAMYAAAVRHMGKLRRPEALSSIKTAARDFHPWVRAASMYAMATMQRWTLDGECRQLVRTCLEDSHDFVREAARQTAAHHNLNASISGMQVQHGGDIGISLN